MMALSFHTGSHGVDQARSHGWDSGTVLPQKCILPSLQTSNLAEGLMTPLQGQCNVELFLFSRQLFRKSSL